MFFASRAAMSWKQEADSQMFRLRAVRFDRKFLYLLIIISEIIIINYYKLFKGLIDLLSSPTTSHMQMSCYLYFSHVNNAAGFNFLLCLDIRLCGLILQPTER